MLLVGPGGQTAIIMSDAGGSPGGISNVTLTLDDFAADPLPVSTPAPVPLVTTGTYRPTNYPNPNPADPDTFPSPCPITTPSPDSVLSTFNGTNPNGTWSLYIVDDNSDNTAVWQHRWGMGADHYDRRRLCDANAIADARGEPNSNSNSDRYVYADARTNRNSDATATQQRQHCYGDGDSNVHADSHT